LHLVAGASAGCGWLQAFRIHSAAVAERPPYCSRLAPCYSNTSPWAYPRPHQCHRVLSSASGNRRWATAYRKGGTWYSLAPTPGLLATYSQHASQSRRASTIIAMPSNASSSVPSSSPHWAALGLVCSAAGGRLSTRRMLVSRHQREYGKLHGRLDTVSATNTFTHASAALTIAPRSPHCAAVRSLPAVRCPLFAVRCSLFDAMPVRLHSASLIDIILPV
jgi:hypothetical protein